MANFLYKNDLPNDLELGNSIAIDTETMGLKTIRDRLCLVQISSGDGNAHLVQFEKGNYSAPNLKKLLINPEVLRANKSLSVISLGTLKVLASLLLAIEFAAVTTRSIFASICFNISKYLLEILDASLVVVLETPIS